MNIFSLALKNLWKRKTRTCLTILSVGISIAAFVSLVGIAAIFTGAFRETYDSRDTDLIVREKGNFDFLSSGVDQKYADKIRQLPEISSVSSMLIDFSSTGKKDYFLVFGWEADSDLFGKLKIEGRRPRNEDEAAVGATISKKLNKNIGDSVEIKGSRFNIVGVFQSRSIFEDGSVVVLLDKLQKIKKVTGKVTLLNIVVNKNSGGSGSVEYTRSLIADMFPDAEVKNVRDIAASGNVMSTLLNFTWAISIIAFIVAISGIANTMVTSVLEQTREIGILLAMGWRKSRVIALVMHESVLLGILGGFFGLVMGYGIMYLLLSMPQLQNFGRVQYDFIFMAKVIVISLVVGFLSGIYPALRAIFIEPIEALRYE